MHGAHWAFLFGAALMALATTSAGAGSALQPYAAVEAQEVFEGGGYVIVSSLAVLPNKDLLCVWFAQKEHAARLGVRCAGEQAILGRASKDSSKTWGPAFLIIDSPADKLAGDPMVMVSGDKVLVFASMEKLPHPPWSIELWLATSEDNARTWSAPRALPIPRTRPAVSGRCGITLRDGTILVPYWWDFGAQLTGDWSVVKSAGDIPGVVGTLISTDGGKSWEQSTDVYGTWSQSPGTLMTADEPAIVSFNDKDVFMVLRSAMPDGHVQETWSHDGGRTWEKPRSSGITAWNTPSCLWRLKNGWVVRMWDNSRTSRFPLVAAISKDRCRTWSQPRTLVDYPEGSKWPTQASYPSVVEAADGSLVACWCHWTPEGRCVLAIGRFTSRWILSGQPWWSD